MIIWNEFTKPYKNLLEEEEKNFNKLKDKLKKQFSYSPIEKISSRIKEEKSALNKLSKKNLKITDDNLKNINDIAGLRIICKFLDDIPEIISLIKNDETIKIIKEKDFINEKKETGYMSYHIICKKNNLIYEIQLRTMAMDFWATNEHLLKYKYQENIPANLKEQLKKIANISHELDKEINNIRKEIKIGTISSRIINQIKKSIHILEQLGLIDKSQHYKKQLLKNHDNLETLRKIAIKAREDVPKQYWN